MWEWIKWLPVIVAVMHLHKTFKKFIKNLDTAKIKKTADRLHDYFMSIVNHPLYDKIGIGLNAILLLASFVYAAFGFALLLEKGYSIKLATILVIIIAGASINLFYQSLKLYK